MSEERNLIEELDLSFHPLTQKLWRDFEMLFGAHGACGGCWCMHWKLRGQAFSESAGDTARQMQKNIVDAKTVPGLLAYSEGYPVGWIAIEPRSQYVKLAHSRVLKPIDDAEVWSIVCFFIEKKHRRKGISAELIKAATAYAKSRDAKIVEGYPIYSAKNQPDPFVYTGTASAFKRAGFKEVARNSPTRPIFRYMVFPSPSGRGQGEGTLPSPSVEGLGMRENSA
jgi:GNAT superfamily N-acetyltransferase